DSTQKRDRLRGSYPWHNPCCAAPTAENVCGCCKGEHDRVDRGLIIDPAARPGP
ncbi:unnamed protein product, partial [Amoebophrya sp. A120]